MYVFNLQNSKRQPVGKVSLHIVFRTISYLFQEPGSVKILVLKVFVFLGSLKPMELYSHWKSNCVLLVSLRLIIVFDMAFTEF